MLGNWAGRKADHNYRLLLCRKTPKKLSCISYVQHENYSVEHKTKEYRLPEYRLPQESSLTLENLLLMEKHYMTQYTQTVGATIDSLSVRNSDQSGLVYGVCLEALGFRVSLFT